LHAIDQVVQGRIVGTVGRQGFEFAMRLFVAERYTIEQGAYVR
jgi:hypothetical protein